MVHDLKTAVFAIALLAAGCSGGGDASRSTASSAEAQPEVQREAQPEVRVPLLPAGGDSALVAAMGVLEVEGPCLYLRAADGSRTLPLFALDGVRWSAGSLVAGDRSFKPGQSVTLGGTPVNALPPDVPWVQAPDPRCSAPRFFIAHQID